jgi:16S rRNA (guanine(966)-N(2))-methyltransferase RsmD
MRIIAGHLKGRKLETLKGNDVRPTGDKVKEAIFSMIDGYLEGSVVIDLFSGTGNLGLEAISRGAELCYFGDNKPESIRIIKANIESCKVSEKCIIIPGGFEKVLSKIPKKADIIFLDPPYEKGYMISCFEKIEEFEILNEGGIIVSEHGLKEKLPDVLCGFEKLKEKRYGTIIVSLFN